MSIENSGTEEGVSCSDVAHQLLGVVDDPNAADELGTSKVLCEGIRGCQGEKSCQMTCSEVVAATSNEDSGAIATSPTATSPTTLAANDTALPDTTAWGENEATNVDQGSPKSVPVNETTIMVDTSTSGGDGTDKTEEGESSSNAGNRTLLLQ